MDDILHYAKRSGHASAALNPAFVKAVEDLQDVPNLIQSQPATAALVNERAIHRLMCYGAMAGKTNKQIAEELDVSTTTVSSVLRQPWARKFITEEMRVMAKAGGLDDFIASEGINTARTIIELRDSIAVPAAVRATLCINILDRILGKPTQHVKTETNLTFDEAAKEDADIERELNNLREQVKSGTN